MINTVKKVFAGFVCAGIISSCKKDLPDNKAISSGTETAGRSSLVTNDYYPFSNGIVFNYADSVSGVQTASRAAIEITGDTVIDGESYAKVITGGSATKYHSAKDGVVRFVEFNGSEKITSTVLKANEPVGSVWTDTFTTGGVRGTYEWKIVAKGISRTVAGVKYADVIHVHLNGSAMVQNDESTVFANADYFYAPNIGLIEHINYNTVSGKSELHRLLQGTTTK